MRTWLGGRNRNDLDVFKFLAGRFNRIELRLQLTERVGFEDENLGLAFKFFSYC